MGLRCLLGHDFGEPEVEREREERGDEMVVTMREVKTCRRCGEERVVSENKEVTAIRTPEDIGLDDGAAAEEPADEASVSDEAGPSGGGSTTVDSEAGASAPGTRTSAPDTQTSAPGAGSATNADPAGVTEPDVGGGPTDPDQEDAEILDEAEPTREPGEWPDPHGSGQTASESADRVDGAAEAIAGAGTGRAGTDDADDAEEGDDGADESGSVARDDEADGSGSDDDRVAAVAAEEDAELLDAGDDEGVSEADAAATTSESGSAWPDHDGEDEGFTAEGTTTGGPTDVSFGGGLGPESTSTTSGHGGAGTTEDARDRGEYVGQSGSEDDEGTSEFVRVDSTVEGGAGTTEFFCPNCGHSEPAGDTSMRVGDICPACHKGYVAERDV